MSRTTKTASRYAVYYETTTVSPAGRTIVQRESLRDSQNIVRTFATPDEAIATWEIEMRARGGEPREFARERGSRFFEVVMPGTVRGVLYHVRAKRAAA